MGNALRSISLRIRGYDEETEQLSEDLVGVTGKVADLTKTASNNGKGISLFTDETQTQYKDLVDYLGEIYGILDEISAKDKQELLELLFGKNRANAGAALLTNYDQVYNVIETIKGSSGSAEREMSTMMDSINYKANQFKETLVGIAQGLFNQDFMKSMVDSGTRVLTVFEDLTPSISFILEQFAALLEFVTKLADAIGGIPLLIAGIGLKNVGSPKMFGLILICQQ